MDKKLFYALAFSLISRSLNDQDKLYFELKLKRNRIAISKNQQLYKHCFKEYKQPAIYKSKYCYIKFSKLNNQNLNTHLIFTIANKQKHTIKLEGQKLKITISVRNWSTFYFK